MFTREEEAAILVDKRTVKEVADAWGVTKGILRGLHARKQRRMSMLAESLRRTNKAIKHVRKELYRELRR